MFFLSRFWIWVLGILAIVGAVLSALAGVKNAGKNAVRVENLRKVLEIKNAQQEAAANSPSNRDELIDELRNGTF